MTDTTLEQQFPLATRNWDETPLKEMTLVHSKVHCYCPYCGHLMYIGQDQHTDVGFLQEEALTSDPTFNCTNCDHTAVIPAEVPALPLRQPPEMTSMTTEA